MRISDWSSDVCSSDLRENGGQAAGYQVKLIEKAAHAYLLARKLSMTFWPSGPARLIHSASMVSPTLSRPFMSSSVGLMISMPFLLRLSRYHWVFSLETFQPRCSASWPALSKAFLLLS